MSIDKTANIEADILNPDQGSGDVTNTQQIYVLDTLTQMMIKDLDLTAPPGGEADGDRYVVAAGGTGAWNGLDGKIVTNRDATGQWQVDELKAGYVAYIEDEAVWKGWNGTAWETLEAGTGIAGIQIYYVGKHGSDTNTGKSDAQAFLTHTKAASEALAQTPAANNRFIIFCHDAGIYAEDFTLSQYVSLYTPNTIIEGKIAFDDDCYVTVNKMINASTYCLQYQGTNRATARFNHLEITAGGGGAVRSGNASGGILDAIGNYIKIDSGHGITAFDGNHMSVKINEIECVTGIGVGSQDASKIWGSVGRIFDAGASIGGIRTLNTSIISVNVGEVNCNVAYNVGAGTTLNIFIGSVTGTKTVAGTLNETIAGESIRRGTAFPNNPTDGAFFYRTDLDHLFRYDNGRAKWLGELDFEVAGRNGNVSINTYLRRIDGMAMSATLGTYIPYDVTVVGITFAKGNANAGTLEVRRDGVLVASIATGASASGSDMTLNGNFASGGIMSAYWNSGNLTTNVQLKIYYRRRAT